MSEATRDRVLITARRLGYRANAAARNLKSSKTRLLGYAWHTNPTDEPHWVLQQFIYHLARVAEQYGYHLLTFTHADQHPIGVYEELIQSGRVDGFILAETTLNDPRIAFLNGCDFPFVAFGRSNPDWDFSWVDTDGAKGTALATQHLIDQGHRQIAFLGWSDTSLAGNHRLDGYERTMRAAQLPIPDTFVVRDLTINFNVRQMDALFEEWYKLDAAQRPTAIVAVNDDIAVQAMRAAQQREIRVGEDLAIVGFDDSPAAHYLSPGLTSVRQPLQVIAGQLVETLNGLVEAEPSERQSKHALVLPELVVRQSSLSEK